MKKIKRNIISANTLFTCILRWGLIIKCFLIPILCLSQKESSKKQKDSAKAIADTVRQFNQQDSLNQGIFYDSLRTNQDSAATKYYNFFKKFGKEIEQQKIAEYGEDTISTRQDLIIEEIKRLTIEADAYLNSGLDTTGLDKELARIAKWYRLAAEGVLVNRGSIQTHRNLETTYKILRELLTKTHARKESLDKYYKKLVDYRNKIDSLYQTSVLFKFSADSMVAIRYINKLIVVAEEIKPIGRAIKKTLVSVSELQTKVNRFVNTLNSSIEQIAVYQNELSKKIFQREVANLGGPVRFFRPFSEIVEYSVTKASLGLVFYVRNELARILLLFGLYWIFTLFLSNLKKNLKSKGLLNDEENRAPVLEYPALSGLFIAINIFQFIFPDPPFIWNSILWTISSICLTLIARKFVSKFWMKAWICLFVLFLLACMDNLILQASRPERRLMLLLSIAGIITCSFIIVYRRKEELKQKAIFYFVIFVIIIEIIAVWANAIGRYNLAKACLTSGFFSIIVAILFFATIQFINDALALASKAYRVPGKKLFRVNFEKVGSKAPTILYVFLVIGWMVLIGQSFYAHKLISGPINRFIHRERFIGEFSFTIDNVLMFLLILYLTGMISRLVSFVGSNGKVEIGNTRKKGGTGSWVLITRISVIIVGFLLAMAAIGLPMDRLTIVLSALGVGVGFGLQALVNNLVSGLIISFEKPVNVGDVVEIGGRSGTIKSIGFRSSILTTVDGADIVIPNGDMLNEHLVNWTHKDRSRQVNIVTALAHGTDLEKAMRILENLPVKDERVMTTPGPIAAVKDYNPLGIDMQLSFWVKNIREWASVKSDTILAMDKAFRENEIEIPVQRQVVTFRPGEDSELKGKEEK
jgi:potassium efflux system protein